MAPKKKSKNDEVLKHIERISEEVVFSEVTDLQSLATIHSALEEVIALIDEKESAELFEATKGIAVLIESIILDEVADKAVSFVIVQKAVSSLQTILRKGCSAEEAEMPSVIMGKSETEKAFKLPPHIDESIFAEFLSRQGQILDEIESLVLDIEKAENQKALDSLKRLLHTMKGEAGMLGLDDVEKLCHASEDCLVTENPSLYVDGLLKIKDWLSRKFDACSGKGKLPESVENMIMVLTEEPLKPVEAKIESVAIKGSDNKKQAEEDLKLEEDLKILENEPALLEGDPELLAEFVNEAMEHLDSSDEHLLTIENNPRDEDALNAVFRAFHTIKGVSGFLALHEIKLLAHEAENLLDKARKNELLMTGDVIDVTFQSVDTMKRMVQNVQSALSNMTPLQSVNSLAQLIKNIKAVAKGGSSGFEIEKPAAVVYEETAAVQTSEERIERAAVQVRESIKVDAERLDRLVDTIGELVIAESMISQSSEFRINATADLLRQMSQLDKITRELQEMGMSLRMVPVRSTFQKMARLVRDLSKKSGKRVDFVMKGEDTELDKTVVDRIGDPLVHMVRNAVDHGIEATAQDRKNAGKSEVGHVELRSFHKGGSIYIEIQDDGKGLDKEAIIKKATERGLVKQGDSLTDREIFGLIFEPGFSTAKKITDVSGRGVGMDVVKKNIEALRGQVEISSEVGKGSVFSIKLPLTLAIIDGMVVKVGSERYIIPTLSIVTTIRPEKKDTASVFKKGKMLTHQDELIPFFYLSKIFEISNSIKDPSEALVIIVESDGKKVGLVTDVLLGQQQIVIKSLGSTMRSIPGISGGAIMPDGQVGLILDIDGLVKLANSGKDENDIENLSEETQMNNNETSETEAKI